MHRRSTGLTRRDVDALYRPLRDTHDFLTASRSDPETGGKTTLLREGMKIGEIGIGAGALGYYYGRTQKQTIGNTPIPIGLAVGAGGLLLSLLGPVRKFGLSSHLTNLSAGAIASWTTQVGMGYGLAGRQAAGQPAPVTSGLVGCGLTGCTKPAALPPPAVVSGMYGAPPAPMTEAELAALGRQIR
jgi:hypothetical protein